MATTILDESLSTIRNNDLTTAQNYTSFFLGQTTGIPTDLLYTQYYPDYSYSADVELTAKLDNILNQQNIITSNVIYANNFSYAKDYTNYRKNTDLREINDLTIKTKGDLYKTNQSFWDYKNSISKQYFDMNVLRLSIVTAVCIGMVMMMSRVKDPKLTQKMAIIISCSIFGLYLLVIIVMYSNWVKKRNDDWSKYNFKPPSK